MIKNKAIANAPDAEMAYFGQKSIAHHLLKAFFPPLSSMRILSRNTRRLFAVGIIAVTTSLITSAASAQSDLSAVGLTAVYGSPAAPDLALRDLDGNIRRLADQHGKVVVINFWATWCPPCLAEMPSMQRAYGVLDRDRFEIFAINIGDEDPAIKEFIAEFEPTLTFPILRSEPETMELWGVKGLPTTFFVDKQGRIIYVAIGGRDLDSDHITERIQALMDAPE
jgi:thiol-disulfide isomerase/thioredoxin